MYPAGIDLAGLINRQGRDGRACAGCGRTVAVVSDSCSSWGCRPFIFHETSDPTWLGGSYLRQSYVCSSPVTVAEKYLTSLINDCKLEKLEQHEFISLVWEALNILFTVPLKKKKRLNVKKR